MNELNQLTDVCDALKSLHIAIGFLSSAGGDPLMSVHEYLHTGLRMTLRNGLKSGKVNLYLKEIISLIYTLLNLLNQLGKLLLAHFSSGLPCFEVD